LNQLKLETPPACPPLFERLMRLCLSFDPAYVTPTHSLLILIPIVSPLLSLSCHIFSHFFVNLTPFTLLHLLINVCLFLVNGPLLKEL
jgi:hypothetical protein